MFYNKDVVKCKDVKKEKKIGGVRLSQRRILFPMT